MSLTLVIMAAGMGSRYGGLKQIEPVGPNGEIMMEYAIYDAKKAGFDKVVFIIKRNFELLFKQKIGYKIENNIFTEYVMQENNNLPCGFKAPYEREKPWGTGHAVLSCKNCVDTPFAVINADDFYGRTSFFALAEFLNKQKNDSNNFCLVGFELLKTLTENGSVSRGVCDVDESGYLLDINERTKIEKTRNGVCYAQDGKFIPLSEKTIVSLNTWGFTPLIFKELEASFSAFLRDNKDNLLKAEYFLPTAVGSFIKEKKATAKVVPTNEKWYGVTYKEDRETVVSAIKNMVDNGVYPENLWE